MLSKKEKAVMKAIYYKAKESNDVCLMRPIDILNTISPKLYLTSEDLPKIINALAMDNYYELDQTERKSETYYCFTLKQKGQGFYREILNEKRWIYFKISFSIALAIFVFLFKLILDAIAGK